MLLEQIAIYMMRSLATGQNPIYALSGHTTSNYKGYTLQALFLRPDVVHNQHITSSKDNCSQEHTPLALAGVGQSIEHWPANQGVTRSISSLGKIPRSWARPLVEGPQ